MLDEALRYRNLNLSVIPVGRDKKPLVSWLPYQQQRASEEEIKAWWAKYPHANIGIVTGKISGITVLDCDSTEAIEAFSEHYKGDTPSVKTPRGQHFYFTYAEGIRNTVKIAGMDIDIRGEGGYVVVPPSVNADGLPYAWHRAFTGFSALDSLSSISFSFSLYKDLLNSTFSGNQQSSTSSTFFNIGRRDEDLFHVANALVKGGAKKEIVPQVLKILAENCSPPFPEKEIDAKIQSALERAKRRERNLTKEVSDFIDSTTGNFSSTEIQHFLQISTLPEKKNLSMILKRLCGDGKIEKYGSKNGQWRKVDGDIEFMDFVNVSKEGVLDIELPLGIHKKTMIFPKAVIVLAGVTGFGKTTWMLNIVRDNMHKYNFYYFNAEMSPLALNKKLSYFMHPINQWNMKVIPDHKWDYGNIADKVFPDDINIIDYLEPDGDKPYGIHGVVTAIIKRLNKGIAIIATQKKPNVDLSTGGVYTAKAASLYLSLDWGRIKIFKNRYREEDTSPNLIMRDFEVTRGQHISPIGGWYNEQSKKESDKIKKYADYGITRRSGGTVATKEDIEDEFGGFIHEE
jgi:hypothetical protein